MKTHSFLQPRSGLWFVLLVAIPQLLWADVLTRTDSGSFFDNMWHDQTTNMNNVNPKPGDDDYLLAGAMVTASGGSAHLLSGGGTLSLSGTFTATDAGLLTLSGAGKLSIQAIVEDESGEEGVTVAGGHLIAQNGANLNDVTNKGTVVDTICDGPCGAYSGGSSLTITGLGGPGQANFTTSSKLTANGGLTGFFLNLASASTAVVSSMTNSSARIDGAGTLLTVSGDFSLSTQSIDISNGGAAMVGGDLTQVSGAGAYITDRGSNLTVNGDFDQNSGADTDIEVYSGASVTVKGTLHQIRGQVYLQDSGSALTVQNDLSDKGGFVDVKSGAHLSVDGNLVLDGGTDVDGDKIQGGGSWTDAGTVIDTSAPMFVGNSSSAGAVLGVSQKALVKSGNVTVGANAGSLGTVMMSDAGTIWEVQSSGMSIGQRGTGNFTVQSGAELRFDSGTSFAIGLGSGAHGTLTCDGASVDATKTFVAVGQAAQSNGNLSLTNSSFVVGKDFTVGDSGSGNVTFDSSSTLSVTGAATDFLIGSEKGSVGAVSGDGHLTVAGPTTIGVSGNGFLGSDGGTFNLSNTNGVVVGSKAGSNGMIVLAGNTSLTLAGPLLIGDAGSGSVEVDSQSKLTLPAIGLAGLALGGQKSGKGTMTVTSGGTFNYALPMLIGKAGKGIVNETLKSTINAFGFTAPFSDGGQATISVDDSSWVNTYNIYLGDNSAGDPASTLSLTNGGTMRVGDRMTIFQTGSVTIDKTSMIAVGSGAFGGGGTLRVSDGGILSGFGRVNGQVIVGPGGQVFPGDSPGIFNVNGAYQQLASSTYSAEIGGTTAGSGFDQINVTGAATLGGLLKVRLVNGFTPAVGQTFQIVKATSIKGSFAVISQPSQAGINVKSSGSGVTITITSVVAGAPVISSATTATAAPGQAFHYQISASNSPSSYGASHLPPGLTVNHTTGVISGTPTKSGAFVVPINANNGAGSGQADLVLAIDPTFNLSALPESNLLNISTRLDVLTGGNVLIGGFIINGTAPKQVLLRGIGPSLKAFGITGALADPVLELHEPNGTVVTNDNWQSTQSAAIKATGLAPSDALESAILATLKPGAYTVIMHGNNNGTGIGLIEAYDRNPTAASELANISTRGFVEAGNNVMIGGFIVGGGGGGFSTVIVRGLGPSLTAAGVQGALANPTLELHDVNGTVIGANDDWMTGPDHQTISKDKLAPSNPKESALLANLPPGSYTAILKGVNSGTGVGLVEVYQVQ